MKRTSRRPRRNPIPPRDATFLLDPYNWVEGTVLEDYCPEDDAGFFHVTTNRDRVFKQGLKSRSETGIVGLGGGPSDPSGKWVSFVISRSRAMWLFSSMRGLLVAAQDGDASDVLLLTLEWTGFPGDIWENNWEDAEADGWDRASEDLGDLCATLGVEPPDDIQSLSHGGPWKQMVNEQRDDLNRRWNTPERRYELAQFVETRLRSTFAVDDWWDGGVCMPLVGFTASAKKYLNLSPSQFSIVQAAIKQGARSEDIPQECEMRFSSNDIRLVAVDCQIRGNTIPVPPRFDE